MGKAVGTVAPQNGSGIPVGEQNLSESTPVHMFICEFGCGFTGVFEGVNGHENECAMRPGKDLETLAHEKTCPSRPDKGTRFEDVSAHEKACTSRQETDASVGQAQPWNANNADPDGNLNPARLTA